MKPNYRPLAPVTPVRIDKPTEAVGSGWINTSLPLPGEIHELLRMEATRLQMKKAPNMSQYFREIMYREAEKVRRRLKKEE